MNGQRQLETGRFIPVIGPSLSHLVQDVALPRYAGIAHVACSNLVVWPPFPKKKPSECMNVHAFVLMKQTVRTDFVIRLQSESRKSCILAKAQSRTCEIGIHTSWVRTVLAHDSSSHGDNQRYGEKKQSLRSGPPKKHTKREWYTPLHPIPPKKKQKQKTQPLAGSFLSACMPRACCRSQGLPQPLGCFRETKPPSFKRYLYLVYMMADMLV